METPKVRLEFLILLGALGAVAVFGLLLYDRGPFHSSSVCGRCGAVKMTTQWQFPGSRITFYGRSSLRSTPVSLALTTNQIVGSHKHEWRFVHGNGNGIHCALGNASEVRVVADTPEVARLLGALHQFGERDFRDKIITNLFDPDACSVVRTVSFMTPTKGFADKEEMHVWVSAESQFFDQMLADHKR
jgi:hypothetical protein